MVSSRHQNIYFVYKFYNFYIIIIIIIIYYYYLLFILKNN